MSNYYVMREYHLCEKYSALYKIVVSDFNYIVGVPGIVIDYQEKEGDEFVIKNHISFSEEEIDWLLKILTEIKNSTLTKAQC